MYCIAHVLYTAVAFYRRRAEGPNVGFDPSISRTAVTQVTLDYGDPRDFC